MAYNVASQLKKIQKQAQAAKKVVKGDRPSYTALRLYTFCNFYLSSIQQGIQSAHVVSELYDTYEDDMAPPDRLLYDWGSKHKTIIVCNGGMGQDIVDGFLLLEPLCQVSYPICAFNEEYAAFGATMDDVHTGDETGPMTAFGLVLPDTVYDARPVYTSKGGVKRRTGAWEYGVHGVSYHKWSSRTPEAAIMDYVSSKSLAR